MLVRALGLAIALTVACTAAAQQPVPSTWPEQLVGHGGPVKAVAVAAGGTLVLSTSFDYSAILWRIEGTESRILHRLIGHEAPVNDAQFVSDTRAVTVSDDGSVALWDLEAGRLVSRMDTGDAKMLSVAVDAGGHRVVAASWDRTAHIFDIRGDSLVAAGRLDGHRGNVNDVAYLGGGSKILTASYDGGIRIFEGTTGALDREAHAHGWGVNVIAPLPDGEHVLFGAVDGAVGVLALSSGEIAKTLQPHDRPVLAAALSPDGSLAATGGGDGRIRLFSTGTWELLQEFENPFGPVWGLAIAPKGDAVLYAGLDDQVKVWQVQPRKPFEPVATTFPRRFQVSEAADVGERQFARKCSVCHTLGPDDQNRAGPTLYRLFGRKAGSLPGYPYSRALKESDLVWTEETVSDLFDHGPDVVTPGSKMPLQRLTSSADRQALIAFLKRATAPGAASADKEKQE